MAFPAPVIVAALAYSTLSGAIGYLIAGWFFGALAGLAAQR